MHNDLLPLNSLPPSVLLKYKGASKVFFETGTFTGESTRKAVKAGFDQIYSVELDIDRYKAAKKKFATIANITLFQGESVAVMREVLPKIMDPILFWLDAHPIWIEPTPIPSTPLLDELRVIKECCTSSHIVILIDDMSMVGTYWKTFGMEDVERGIRLIDPQFTIVRESNRFAPQNILVAYK